ncbi:MAG: AarF/UbiB family protein, partial [Phycisphaerales bacterium]|nr:AarF/UbiB family protein [Phycisphaerales bacterium]
MKEIVSVAAKFGFGEIIRDTKLGTFLGKFYKAHEVDQKPAPVRFRLALEALGPTFMKLGQVLSMRPDLVPPSWSEELANLQDSCPVVPWVEIKKEIEREYGSELDSLFSSIEETPIGDGSMAQVHRAVSIDGNNIVLKILRPNIEKTVRSDLEVLEVVASLLNSHGAKLGFDPREVIDTFAEALDNELDLRHEADSTKMLKAMTADETATFPEVYPECSTKRILAIEEVNGAELTKWEKQNYTQEQRDRIVANGA